MSDRDNVLTHLDFAARNCDGRQQHLAQWAAARIREQDAEIARLAAIVERLPKTADGVPIVQGDTVYFWSFDDEGPAIACDQVDHVQCDTVVLMEWDEEKLAGCYSTRWAAIKKENCDA